MNKPSATPGICRIDQPEKHNHGFFVRLQRRGKIHSAFFTDKNHGGQAQALAAAQEHHRKLAAKLGTPAQMSRRGWAQLRRRKGSTNVVGVQKLVDRRSRRPRIYWKATWSPEPYVVRQKIFSAKKFGARNARRLAIRARRAGVRSMQPARLPSSPDFAATGDRALIHPHSVSARQARLRPASARQKGES